MLELKHITKEYPAGGQPVEALKGVDLQFRESEFVSILGPSGCGKTTLLNIIGGLDQYTSGDLVINGRSTKDFKDRDWDAYRNHSIGFVFQSYNLIPHQTVLQNVELALTLSGVSKGERRRRAKEALEQVGLGSQPVSYTHLDVYKRQSCDSPETSYRFKMRTSSRPWIPRFPFRSESICCASISNPCFFSTNTRVTMTSSFLQREAGQRVFSNKAARGSPFPRALSPGQKSGLLCQPSL